MTSFVSQSRANVLAVETIAQKETDLGINWVDWNPAPPDKDMGLWRDVYLRPSGPVTIRYPQVITHFPAASPERADLTVEAELHNAGARQVTGILSGKMSRRHSKSVSPWGPVNHVRYDSLAMGFHNSKWPIQKFGGPRKWGTPNLHELSLQFATGTARFRIPKAPDSGSAKSLLRWTGGGTGSFA